ncbi:MAG: PadR family transcriptional regulator [Candidatus Nezhaarchaeales archaeon]
MKIRRPPFLRVLTLAILINEKELHGYSIYKKILYHTHMKWKPSIGTIYRILNEMVQEGLVTKRAEKRRYSYAITHEGIEYFIENSRIPMTKMAGVLATMIEAYLKMINDRPDILTRSVGERLRNLREVLKKCEFLNNIRP